MRVRRLAAVALTLPLLVSCSDDTDPQLPDPTPTVSSSAPTTPPPTTEPPEDETPQAFIRRFIELGNESQQIGDTGAYRQATRNCDSCDNAADRIDAIFAAGGTVSTEGESVLRIKRSGDRWLVDIEAAPTEFRESSDGPVETLPGGRYSYAIALVDTARGFKVTYIAEVST